MEFIPLENQKYYNDCAPLVNGLGYALLALKISPGKSITKICVTIASKTSHTLGLDDCAKVHRTLQDRLAALMAGDGVKNELSMQVETPGIDHNIKNAAEFPLFIGRFLRVWDKTLNDWVSGVVKDASEKSVTLITVTKVDSTEGVATDATCESTEKTIAYGDIAKAKLIG